MLVRPEEPAKAARKTRRSYLAGSNSRRVLQLAFALMALALSARASWACWWHHLYGQYVQTP
jgi:hypothetical protein